MSESAQNPAGEKLVGLMLEAARRQSTPEAIEAARRDRIVAEHDLMQAMEYPAELLSRVANTCSSLASRQALRASPNGSANMLRHAVRMLSEAIPLIEAQTSRAVELSPGGLTGYPFPPTPLGRTGVWGEGRVDTGMFIGIDAALGQDYTVYGRDGSPQDVHMMSDLRGINRIEPDNLGPVGGTPPPPEVGESLGNGV